MHISPAQCRGARGLLGWSQSDLSRASKTATKTIADFERGAREPYPRTLADVRRALENAGLEFIDENGGGVGVRFRKAQHEPPIPPRV
jgi:transcriptional regulator with XRE-family HTH domain